MVRRGSQNKAAIGKAAMEFKSIRLIEAHCKVGQFKPNQLPNRANQETQVQLQQIDPRGRKANIFVTLRLTVTYSDPEAIGPPPVQVTAQYLLQYVSPRKINPKSLEDFFQNTAVPH